MGIFGERGRGLPLSAAALIANCIAELPAAACQVIREDEAIHVPQVMQVMERNELAPHIDEEALHADSAAQIAPQEATAAVRRFAAHLPSPSSDVGAGLAPPHLLGTLLFALQFA
jgi:hypothetical protein